MTSGLPPRILITRGQFAERAYSAQLELAELPRLRDAVQEQSADIQVDIRLDWDTQWQRPAMQLGIDMCLRLQCQRCMQTMQWSRQVNNRLLLLGEGEQIAEPEDMDIAPVEDGEVDTLRLIEDEILLVLPLAPLHGSDTDCGRTMADDHAGKSRVDNPFAALAGLKTKH